MNVTESRRPAAAEAQARCSNKEPRDDSGAIAYDTQQHAGNEQSPVSQPTEWGTNSVLAVTFEPMTAAECRSRRAAGNQAYCFRQKQHAWMLVYSPGSPGHAGLPGRVVAGSGSGHKVETRGIPGSPG